MAEQKATISSSTIHTPFQQTYFHGTKADCKVGDLIKIGYHSNFGERNKAKYIFLTATLDAAVWELSWRLAMDGKEFTWWNPPGRLRMIRT